MSAEIIPLPQKGWVVSMNSHIIPLGDRIEHIADSSCACQPEVSEIPVDELGKGVYQGWVISHNALDGRE